MLVDSFPLFRLSALSSVNGAVSRNNRMKRVVPCRYLDGYVKENYEMCMAFEPDLWLNFFHPPAHLCAVTSMTETLLH